MKSFLRRCLKTLAPVAVIALAGCGGQVADDEDGQDMSAAQVSAATSFNPVTKLAAARKLANQKTDNAAPFHLSGKLVKSTYTWTWTLGGDDGTMVDVVVSSTDAKIAAVHKNTVRPLGIAIIDTGKMTVDPAGLYQRCQGHHHTALPKAMELSQALTQKNHAHWFADYTANDVIVDAITGEVVE